MGKLPKFTASYPITHHCRIAPPDKATRQGHSNCIIYLHTLFYRLFPFAKLYFGRKTPAFLPFFLSNLPLPLFFVSLQFNFPQPPSPISTIINHHQPSPPPLPSLIIAAPTTSKPFIGM
jgi:hypothetical protein